MIETKDAAMVIDYVPWERQDSDSVLFRLLKAALARGKQTYVLVTHEHDDHFYQPLLSWKSKLKGLHIVLGWNFETTDPSVVRLHGRDSVQLPGMKIIAHPSTDAGSGFLVSTKDLTLYHGGDHAAWDTSMNKFHQAELRFAASRAKGVDIAFFPIAQGQRGGCRVTESITNGTVEAINILKPRVVLPMHVQCPDVRAYQRFATQMKERFPGISFRYQSKNNQVFEF